MHCDCQDVHSDNQVMHCNCQGVHSDCQDVHNESRVMHCNCQDVHSKYQNAHFQYQGMNFPNKIGLFTAERKANRSKESKNKKDFVGKLC